MSTQAVVDEENYDKEYRRLRTLTSQTDIRESSVSVIPCVRFSVKMSSEHNCQDIFDSDAFLFVSS